MKNKSKKDEKGFLVSAMVVAIASIGFIGGFVLSGELKERVYRATDKNSSTESSNISKAGKTLSNKTYGFDEKYITSEKDLDYYYEFGTYAGSEDAYFTIEYGISKSELKITRYFYDLDDSQEYTLNFTNNVVEVFLGGFDNDPNKNILFYLLDNGDVYYSYVNNLANRAEYGSYDSISKLSGVVKFYKGNSCDPETNSCNSTTYAQTNDGKIYNLKEYLK